MSYHTHVDFQFSDELPPIESVLARARAYLDAKGIYAVDDVLEDLQTGLEEGVQEFNKLVSPDFEGLFESISTAFPEITFYVRGMGEEYGDVWLRRFRGGSVTARTGPFEEE